MAGPSCTRCKGPFEGASDYRAAWLYNGRLLCCWCAARSGLLGEVAQPRTKRRSKA